MIAHSTSPSPAPQRWRLDDRLLNSPKILQHAQSVLLSTHVTSWSEWVQLKCRICLQLKRLQIAWRKDWSKTFHTLSGDLETQQSLYDSSPTLDNLSNLKRAVTQYSPFLSAESMHLRKKAQIFQDTVGHISNKTYSSFINQRVKQQQIISITTSSDIFNSPTTIATAI